MWPLDWNPRNQELGAQPEASNQQAFVPKLPGELSGAVVLVLQVHSAREWAPSGLVELPRRAPNGSRSEVEEEWSEVEDGGRAAQKTPPGVGI